jgi:hypothetical protein
VRVFKARYPLGFLFASSRHEDFLARYVLREHARGRPLAEILDDPYVRNRWTRQESARLLERPDVVAALGENALEELRQVAPDGYVEQHPRTLRQTTAAPAASRKEE